MALPSTVQWTARATATANMVNGGGFVLGGSGTDYSDQDAAEYELTGLTTAGADAILLSASASSDMVDNIGRLVSGTNATAGWYRIVSVVVGVSITLDRNCTTAAGSNIVFNIGGSLSFNSTLDDDFFEAMIGGNKLWLEESQTFTLGEAVSVASASATNLAPIDIRGFSGTHGTYPTFANRPTIVCGANIFSLGNYHNIFDVKITTTTASGISLDQGSYIKRCTVLNTSTTVDRTGINSLSAITIDSCDVCSQNGEGADLTTVDSNVSYNYFHDSRIGVQCLGQMRFTGNVFAFNRSRAVYCVGTGIVPMLSNTFYGRAAIMGIGFEMSSAQDRCYFKNNIFSGFVSAITMTTSNYPSNLIESNNFYNNTADVTLATKGEDNIALDPQFVSVSEITGTTATSSGSVLTQPGGGSPFSSVEDGVDFLHIISGTGVTADRSYLINSHTADTLTVNNSLGTSSAGDIVYFISVTRDFTVGANMKGASNPKYLNSSTNSFLDMGGVQREEVVTSAEISHVFC